MNLEELNAVTQKAAIGEAKYFLARREGPEFLNALRVIHDRIAISGESTAS